jgi:ribonuclease-3
VAGVTQVRLGELAELQARIGYSFRRLDFLERALTHRSFAHERADSSGKDIVPQDYESLEFLGDSVVGLVISEHLFSTYPKLSEGELSSAKSFLVSASHLAVLSRELGLGAFLKLSHGEEKTGGRGKQAILADLFESLTAAIYLDGGLQAAQRFLLEQFESTLQEMAGDGLDWKDHKSRLQEELHRMGMPEPTYHVVTETGPPHRREFGVAVRVGHQCLAEATGSSKKEAQQRAARLALERLAERQAVEPRAD